MFDQTDTEGRARLRAIISLAILMAAFVSSLSEFVAEAFSWQPFCSLK